MGGPFDGMERDCHDIEKTTSNIGSAPRAIQRLLGACDTREAVTYVGLKLRIRRDATRLSTASLPETPLHA